MRVLSDRNGAAAECDGRTSITANHRLYHSDYIRFRSTDLSSYISAEGRTFQFHIRPPWQRTHT
jgi:hypothetical protein